MAEGENSEAGRKGFPGGKLVMALLVLVLCGGGAIGGLTLALGPSGAIALLTGAEPEPPADDKADDHDMAAADGHDAPSGHGEKAAPKMAVIPFKEIIVNINATTATGRTTSRFMKLNVAMVYDDKAEGANRIEERQLFLRDSFQDYLRQLTERDLQGSIGLITVKQELLRRARTITESDAPQEMLVADLIVQ